MDIEIVQPEITQNLVDASCDEETIRRFWNLIRSGRQEDALTLLRRHRQRLLECCHAQQKKIDCLDYLLYQITQP